MKHHIRTIVMATTTVSTLVLAGCASAPSAPIYNTSASAASQANTFIGESSGKKLKGIGKVALTGCNVMFAISSDANASTSAGLFGDVDGRRAESKISTIYSMEGMDNKTMQAATDELCASAEKKLRAAGYDVMPLSELQKTEQYKALAQSGAAAPYEIKKGDASGGTRYMVFTRQGETVWDNRYQTFGGGIKQGFKAVAGKDGESLDLLLADALGIAVARVNVMVDFAELKSDGDGSKGFLGGLASKNSANITSKAMLSVAGGLDFRSGKQIDCYKNLAGKRGCIAKGVTRFNSKLPVSSEQQFYTSITNATTTSDKAAKAVTAAFSMLGGSGSSSVKRYRVDVTPTGYTRVQKPLADGLVEMAVERSKTFR